MVKATKGGALYDGAPELHVILNEGVPKFRFKGGWGVRDILKVERLISRKYREYMKAVRLADKLKEI